MSYPDFEDPFSFFDEDDGDGPEHRDLQEGVVVLPDGTVFFARACWHCKTVAGLRVDPMIFPVAKIGEG